MGAACPMVKVGTARTVVSKYRMGRRKRLIIIK